MGFNNVNHIEYQTVSLAKLEEKFENGATVDFAALKAVKAIRSNNLPVKVLANGNLTKKLTLKVDAISATAQKAVEAAGGSVELN